MNAYKQQAVVVWLAGTVFTGVSVQEMATGMGVALIYEWLPFAIGAISQVLLTFAQHHFWHGNVRDNTEGPSGRSNALLWIYVAFFVGIDTWLNYNGLWIVGEWIAFPFDQFGYAPLVVGVVALFIALVPEASWIQGQKGQ